MAALVEWDLVLVRHGEPEGVWGGRFLGRLDPGLGAVGRGQAEALAACLPGHLSDDPPCRLLASPLRRAQETAAPLAAAFGLTIEDDDRLQEIDFGTWDGLHRDEVEAVEPGATAAWFDDPATIAPGGGETFLAVAERVQACLADLAAGQGPIVLVAHFGICAVAAALLLGLPLRRADRLCLRRGQAGRIRGGLLDWWGVPVRAGRHRQAFNAEER